MSGGSFQYVYLDVGDAAAIFAKLKQVKLIEEWLRAYEKHDAADEVLLYLKEMETHCRRIETIGRRLAPLLQAVEWTQSSDSNISSVDAAWLELQGLQDATD
jgi:hypothetical protein